MFPLLALAALSAFAGYQYSKAKNKNGTTVVNNLPSDKSDDTSNAKALNTYNYYTNDSETGNTLFGSQKKTKRTLFGGETL